MALTKVYNNVEGFRLLDGNRVVEDVTSFTPPTVAHPTTTISASGMAMDVNMPNTTHLEAMELTIAHNNGVNCRYLCTPGKHTIEARIVRQKYNVAKGIIEHESHKWRFIATHVSTEKGTIENGNPYGSTEKYSVIRYEEVKNGETIILADAMTGDIKMNGRSFTDPVENLLK